MNQKKDIQTIKWIAGVAGPGLWWMGLLLAIRFLQGYTCILYAYGMGRVVDCAAAGDAEGFRRTLVLFILLVLVTLTLQASGRYVTEKGRAVLDRRFRLHVFSQLMGRDYYQVTKVHSGEWMNRIVSDTGVVVHSTGTLLPELSGVLVRMFGALVSLLDLVPQIAMIIVPGGLAIGMTSVLIRRRMKGSHKKMQQADGAVRSLMHERLYSLLVIRVFGREETAVREAGEAMDTYLDIRMRRANFVNLCVSLLAVAINGAQVLGIGLCGWGILHGTITYGTMSSTMYLINLLDSPLAMLSTYVSQYYAMLGSAERLMEIEELAADACGNPVSREGIQDYYQNAFAGLGLRNVCFSYEEGEDNLVLQDLSFHIPRGAFAAFTGESGCGKSTALKVLMDLYPKAGGSGYLQDRDGEEQELDRKWRGLFAYVPQGNQLIAGTIREMLAFGDTEVMKQEDEIFRALQIACADTFVRELKEGLDTLLGERGAGLSEGQMQRLSIARAILADRPVLLLDEATSALDAATEQQLLRNLKTMTDKTVVIITHREAVLDFCDLEIPFRKKET